MLTFVCLVNLEFDMLPQMFFRQQSEKIYMISLLVEKISFILNLQY